MKENYEMLKRYHGITLHDNILKKLDMSETSK